MVRRNGFGDWLAMGDAVGNLVSDVVCDAESDTIDDAIAIDDAKGDTKGDTKSVTEGSNGSSSEGLWGLRRVWNCPICQIRWVDVDQLTSRNRSDDFPKFSWTLVESSESPSWIAESLSWVAKVNRWAEL